ncbi:DMT family transporter [Virgifigura deserti]|uniref:DMT family transporter n=1 Tax=Virgifigura deserti TaxID=2268457 RepID=UPI003CCC05E6
MNAPTATTPGTSGRDVETGILIMAAAMLMVPCMDAIAKTLAATVAPGQVAWARFFFQTIFLLPAVLTMRRKSARGQAAGGQAVPPRLDLHAARGGLIAVATLLFFWALKHLPMADAIAIFFVEPLILTLLSALLLGEPIGWRRLAAVAVGFGGALVIIRPSWQAFGWAAVLPLGSAFCFALYLILTRLLAKRESAAAMQFWAGLFGALVLSAALGIGAGAGIGVIEPVWPSLRDWGLMVGLGVLATVSHILVVFAFRRAPAGVLAPFQYIEIISATLLGLLVFGDFPDATTWAGVAIIIGSGLYVFHRERRIARRAAPLPDTP